jgi:hypothetical protein
VTKRFQTLASNQIVKDLDANAGDLAKSGSALASKLVKKELAGRLVSARRERPRQVLLPFLTEDLLVEYHLLAVLQAPKRFFCRQPSKSAAQMRITNLLTGCNFKSSGPFGFLRGTCVLAQWSGVEAHRLDEQGG